MTVASPKQRVGVRTETVSDYKGLLDLEPAWDQLVKRAGIDHPFLEHTWISTWWECFDADSSLHIVVVNDGDELIGIAPLLATSVRMFGVSVRRLGFFYNDHVPRAGFIVAPGREDAIEAIWKHLCTEQSSWDLLQLCQLPEGSQALDEMQRLAAPLPSGVWCSGESPYVPVNTPWRDYYETLPAKHRSNLRNRTKRLEAIGAISIETVTSQDSLGQALEEGLRLEEAAWKLDSGTAISCNSQVAKFYETFARRAAAKNWLRLNFLRSGDKRVAFDYSLEYRDRVFLLKLGYDPEFSPYSPSILLLGLALERAFTQGRATYDFLGESADWKRRWTDQATPNYWLYIFADSFKGRWLHFIKFRLIPWLKNFRDKEGD
jgi:CelD/BcsL family acetyltransferase involved in cellulose biosynthesis